MRSDCAADVEVLSTEAVVEGALVAGLLVVVVSSPLPHPATRTAMASMAANATSNPSHSLELRVVGEYLRLIISSLLDVDGGKRPNRTLPDQKQPSSQTRI